MEGGGAAPPADTVMSDAAPPPQQAMAMGIENIPATLSHGGRFIQYNIFGNIFEVTAKYKPPIMPIGKGAYGIVWYSLTLFPFPTFRIKSNPKFAFFFLFRFCRMFFFLEILRRKMCFFFFSFWNGRWKIFGFVFYCCVCEQLGFELGDEWARCHQEDCECIWQQDWCKEDPPWNQAASSHGSWKR